MCVPSLVLPLFLVGLASKPSFLVSPFHPPPLCWMTPRGFFHPFQPPTVVSSAYRRPSLPLVLVSIPPVPMILDHTPLALFFSPVAYDTIIIRPLFLFSTASVFGFIPKPLGYLPVIGFRSLFLSWHLVRRIGPALSGALCLHCCMIRLSDGSSSSELG